MDVTFSDEQEVLRKSAREFLVEESPTSVVREVMEQGQKAKGAQELWRKMSELGWMGLAFDEAYGGLGLTYVDLCLLSEEMGRAILPVPWFSTVALAGESILAAGSDEQKKEWITKIATGEIRATLALLEPESLQPGISAISASAKKTANAFELSGTKAFVPDARDADVIVVAALLEATPSLFLAEAKSFQVTEEPTVDYTRPLSTIKLDGVKLSQDSLLGGAPCGWDAISSALDRAATILAAEMVGGSHRVLDLAVDYAKVRHQFGRPIGSFQGVSHRCADMLLQTESARSLVYYAAWCADDDNKSGPLAAAAAKAAGSDTYRSCTAQAIQIHGGIGFTWESDLHLWYRRAFWCAAFGGDAVFHRERVAQLLGL